MYISDKTDRDRDRQTNRQTNRQTERDSDKTQHRHHEIYLHTECQGQLHRENQIFKWI